MINEILTAADIPSKPARFPDPPALHAVYFDSPGTPDFNPDLGPALNVTHDCTVELYAPSIKAGIEARKRLLRALDERSIRYTTQGWYWLNAIQRYQDIIEFSYIKKTGGMNNEN